MWGDLGKLIVAKGFKNLHKVTLILRINNSSNYYLERDVIK